MTTFTAPLTLPAATDLRYRHHRVTPTGRAALPIRARIALVVFEARITVTWVLS